MPQRACAWCIYCCVGIVNCWIIYRILLLILSTFEIKISRWNVRVTTRGKPRMFIINRCRSDDLGFLLCVPTKDSSTVVPGWQQFFGCISTQRGILPLTSGRGKTQAERRSCCGATPVDKALGKTRQRKFTSPSVTYRSNRQIEIIVSMMTVCTCRRSFRHQATGLAR